MLDSGSRDGAEFAFRCRQCIVAESVFASSLGPRLLCQKSTHSTGNVSQLHTPLRHHLKLAFVGISNHSSFPPSSQGARACAARACRGAAPAGAPPCTRVHLIPPFVTAVSRDWVRPPRTARGLTAAGDLAGRHGGTDRDRKAAARRRSASPGSAVWP